MKLPTTPLRHLLPQEPMAPLSTNELRNEPGWGYQLKWDGVRILAAVEKENTQLFSRKLLDKTRIYPEVVQTLQCFQGQRLLLDGEVVYYHPELQRPVFQKVLQRERSRTSGSPAHPFMYVLFDLLIQGDEDLRPLPYLERHERLKQLLPEPAPGLLITDLFMEGETLWRWVEERSWEGIVMKRLSSPYREGKKHRDWYKKKTAVIITAQARGLIIRGGQVASLVLQGEEGAYIGRVSLGLNVRTKQQLMALPQQADQAASPFKPLPADLKKETVHWLVAPFNCKVTFLEWSQDGMMRHPKLLSLEEG